MPCTPEKSSCAVTGTWPGARCQLSSATTNSCGGVVSSGFDPSAIVQLALPFAAPIFRGCERATPESTVLEPFLNRHERTPIQLSAPRPGNVSWPEAFVFLPTTRHSPERGKP